MSRNYPAGVTAHEYERALRAVKAEEKYSATRRNNSIEMKRRTFHSEQSIINAAALQNDIARRYDLPGANAIQKFSRIGKKQVIRESGERNIGERKCSCCEKMTSKTSQVCVHCGYFLNEVQNLPETLAQARGLVPLPPKIESLSQADWNDIEYKLDRRGDAFCPICMEPFNKGHEVLLSCSHMFHR